MEQVFSDQGKEADLIPEHVLRYLLRTHVK